jgi:pyridinium-3,5-biscarboxylic acid mononucleotide synthase
LKGRKYRGDTIDRNTIVAILDDYKKGTIDIDKAIEQFKDFPVSDLGYARLDTHRAVRVGYPEVVYCAGKSTEHLRGILEHLLTGNNSILATRADLSQFEAVRDLSADLVYDPLSRTITLRRQQNPVGDGSYIAVISAGTSDIPVAEEAAVTAEIFGNRVERVFDVGVAGLHRLLGKLDVISKAKVVVAVAGMEGALPSVVGGLISAPIIAVPTSVGYGASFGGLSALLTMLNSCASGISVVNIDNGFGAGYIASTINRL